MIKITNEEHKKMEEYKNRQNIQRLRIWYIVGFVGVVVSVLFHLINIFFMTNVIYNSLFYTGGYHSYHFSFLLFLIFIISFVIFITAYIKLIKYKYQKLPRLTKHWVMDDATEDEIKFHEYLNISHKYRDMMIWGGVGLVVSILIGALGLYFIGFIAFIVSLVVLIVGLVMVLLGNK